MVDVLRGRRTTSRQLMTPVAASLIEVGDLLYYNSTTDEVHPASDQADQLTELANQQLFKRNFVGVSLDRSPATEQTDIMVALVEADMEWEFDAVSATYDVGDLVALNEAAGGTALENQELVAVTDNATAIAKVVRLEDTAATSIRVKFLQERDSGGKLRAMSSVIDAAAGTVTLTADDPSFLAVDPGGGAANLDLPAEADSGGKFMFVVNEADAAETLTIRNDAAATILSLLQNEAGVLFCDGTSWHGLVGGET